MKIWALVTLVLNASWGLNPPNKKPKSQKCSKMRFLTILKFLKIHQKINFCSVRGVTGKSRGQEISIFEVFGNFLIFLFFLVFLGGREILAGGYGAVLVGVSMM